MEASDFAEKSTLFLPKEAQYSYLVNLPANIAAQELKSAEGNVMNSLGEVVNNAMELVEAQSEQLSGVLPKDYDAEKIGQHFFEILRKICPKEE